VSDDDISVEATGETVGEAKWKALRDLERLAPGLDKASVRFQVVSEGERGLLGVGYTPAHVVATATATAPAAPESREDETDVESRVRAIVERVVGAIGAGGRVDVEETDDDILVTVSGGDPGLLIGRHGQTIDAIQYLLNVIAYRAYGEEKRDVVVDAAGYRARRQATLETLALRVAERVRESGEREELEPMTAVERKVVHMHLKDVAGVGTTSEGMEPNRYVVVVPE